MEMPTNNTRPQNNRIPTKCLIFPSCATVAIKARATEQSISNSDKDNFKHETTTTISERATCLKHSAKKPYAAVSTEYGDRKKSKSVCGHQVFLNRLCLFELSSVRRCAPIIGDSYYLFYLLFYLQSSIWHSKPELWSHFSSPFWDSIQ